MLPDEDEIVECPYQSESGIFERTLPDPIPTQVQCMTPVPAFEEESQLAGDSEETIQVTDDTDWYRDLQLTLLTTSKATDSRLSLEISIFM